jgi:hypothetical protein
MKGFWRQLVEHNGPFVARLLRQLATQIELAAPGPPELLVFIWRTEGGISLMPLNIKDTDPDPTASITVLDADGNATTPDDVPAWTSSDESVATVSAAADGLSATITKTGTTGATVIGVTSTRSSDGVVLSGGDTLTVEPSEEATIQVALAPGA